MTAYTPAQIAAAHLVAASDDALAAHLADEPTYFTPPWAAWDDTRAVLERLHDAAQDAFAATFDGAAPTVRDVITHDATRLRPTLSTQVWHACNHRYTVSRYLPGTPRYGLWCLDTPDGRVAVFSLEHAQQAIDQIEWALTDGARPAEPVTAE
ncbi:hypothetical protein SAMN05421776_105361 [Nocardia farcinica]|uniref:Uncharacterized protein n=1 Tax=Nocardia farcinica TaxID=37329 RepID=A0A0H5NCU3_NOCFR|nr:hypothetical protein [Nocardia farcinica]AXK88853.1 hypothetical protein DXT66_27375 [Nocardia farcinica]MBF6410904.1 hypothetical protein [Nocardia farcinica]PFX04022.1 hypothetical protein CJ469_01896 [Nocardia farcinica]PFX10180.1 hypothetical protein CJ468_01027 [Nocardia farcinica]UEX21190.1 hypothetical protein LMJ57_19510 [Nocardia farcinica]